ncbi:MAG TPA: ribosome maturation factor RimM [Oscillatoriaceae cyanobacterium M33_DOE_052]|uniref:Ribosome maturation factor RimM n=1 Tax=Planktothricoides sp. SpSt-374 TaxID=2282167 RepID=A0A7C3VGT1_9CYAN|nr:ribosome maturation factor RimM [Oscillatoriaceae cyanobacterium M33_DOE_052]
MKEWMEIGQIVGAQGVKGEVRVLPNSDFADRFLEPGKRWLQRTGETEPVAVQLLGGRYLSNKGLYVVQLEGVNDRTAAEDLRSSVLLVPESDRPILSEDEYHILDLIGLPVINRLTGETIGNITDIITAANDLLVVNTQDKEILIPFVKEIVPMVDIKNRRIEIVPTPGLLELN